MLYPAPTTTMNRVATLKAFRTLCCFAFSVEMEGYTVRAKEGANKRGNSSRLTQSFHFFMFEPIFSPVNALNQPI